MPIFIGSNALGGIVDIRLGDTPVEAVYLGDELIWENVKVEEVIIPYSTREVKDASKWSDYRAVTTKGQTGLKKVYKKYDGTIVKEEVITQPVDEVVTVGTKPLYETRIEKERHTSSYGETEVGREFPRLVKNQIWYCVINGREVPAGSKYYTSSGQDEVYNDVYEVKYYKGRQTSRTYLRRETVTSGRSAEYIYCRTQ